VLGIGLNVSADRDELPGPQATSLVLAGAAAPDRAAILGAILRELERWYLRFEQAPVPGDAVGSGLRAEYLRCCSTIGREVRVELPGGRQLTGRACDVDAVGRLVVSAGGEVTAVSAGDVVHVRPQE
jgi:BirA family biotin operon repressor/biotin-[acetyl-CoA-carboxylase] ligase